jgi:c-di-GMP-binding flagellar brake protein YcgR
MQPAHGMSIGEARPEYYETHLTEEEERFLVHSAAEVVQILRAIRDRAAMLTAYFGDGTEFALTSLLEIDPESEALLFDMPAKASLVPRLVAGGPVTFTTHLEGIKIKFQVDELVPAAHAGRQTLSSRMPEGVVRMQRREFFRVGCPVSNPPKCTVPYNAGGQALRVEFDVFDVSVGGIALLSRQQKLALEPGEVYQGCTIALPGEGAFTTALEVRNVLPVALRSGTATRVGCRFIRPPGEGIARLQRYTMRIERERRAKLG